MPSAIYYSKNAFRVDKSKTLGRQVAGNDFLQAYCKYNNDPKYWIYAKTKEEAIDFSDFVKNEGINKDIKFINFENTLGLKEAGLLFFPGPEISNLSRNRSFFSTDSWSICGVTHTTSSSRVMKSIESTVTSPLEPWDALICTSQAVKSNVIKIIEITENNLRKRLNAKTFIRPQMPVIPLGIDTIKYNYSENKKYSARNSFGIENDEIVILYLGRLSFHAKANPYPMYKALENTKNLTNKKIVLIECGWYANNELKNAFYKAAEHLSPSIRFIRVNGNDTSIKNKSLAAADIFCSLSDNIQETFGITPIEAMASGLPCVVSDWNGYKDTVRDGIDGYRICSIMPREGFGNDLALRYALEIDTYDMYIGHTSNLISIDIEKATMAFTELVNNPKLRSEMGKNAKERAISEYDWNKVMKKYTNLWNNLNEIRMNSKNSTYYTSPDRLDPFISFSNYPTNKISDDKIISLKNKNIDQIKQEIKDLEKLFLINYASYIIPKEKLLMKLLVCIDGNERTINEIKNLNKDIHHAYLIRAIVWMHKFNLISISN